MLGMVYDFLPFMLLPIYNSMTRIKNDWIEAALDLGANKVTIFFKIILPLTISGVISGIVMVSYHHSHPLPSHRYSVAARSCSSEIS